MTVFFSNSLTAVLGLVERMVGMWKIAKRKTALSTNGGGAGRSTTESVESLLLPWGSLRFAS